MEKLDTASAVEKLTFHIFASLVAHQRTDKGGFGGGPRAATLYGSKLVEN
ncbi:hypothetical protein NUH86_13430 [Sphingobium sp. JS3065]|nr:hypothetical protein [Sphingobium sp. JS3065]UZW54496.1 hypothetical protein NUH86_13430 [Sphingobium sp. JS3065]